MALYPQELQKHPNQSYTEQIVDGTIRTNMDVGPSQSRPRYTRIRRSSKLTIWVDKYLYEIFMSFYTVDLALGSLPFTWENPITQKPATLKFSNAPAVSYIGPLTWEIACEFEEV
jgi:hypothetical protein